MRRREKAFVYSAAMGALRGVGGTFSSTPGRTLPMKARVGLCALVRSKKMNQGFHASLALVPVSGWK